MEWLTANWQMVLAGAGGLFYIAEKIIKEYKGTAWNDILVDGLKFLAGKGPKKLAMIFVILPFLAACASTPPAMEGCEDAFLIKNYDYYKTGSLVIKVGNIQAIKKDVYTKEQAMEVFNEVEIMLKDPNTTYVAFSLYVTNKIKWVNEHAGVEVFILADFLIDMESNTGKINPCDAEIMLKDVSKLKLYTGMIQ